MEENRSAEFNVPLEDAWIISRLGFILAQRLVNTQDTTGARRGLMRALFGLQRLPSCTSGLKVSIDIGLVQVELNPDYVGLLSSTDDGHTVFRLQYFIGSHHCIYGYNQLQGDVRRSAIELRLDDFEYSLSTDLQLFVEDYSDGNEVDAPPLSNQLTGC